MHDSRHLGQASAALDLLRGKALTKTEPASEPPKAETKEN
jgi:carboxyl-terminal processing protease